MTSPHLNLIPLPLLELSVKNFRNFLLKLKTLPTKPISRDTALFIFESRLKSSFILDDFILDGNIEQALTTIYNYPKAEKPIQYKTAILDCVLFVQNYRYSQDDVTPTSPFVVNSAIQLAGEIEHILTALLFEFTIGEKYRFTSAPIKAEHIDDLIVKLDSDGLNFLIEKWHFYLNLYPSLETSQNIQTALIDNAIIRLQQFLKDSKAFLTTNLTTNSKPFFSADEWVKAIDKSNLKFQPVAISYPAFTVNELIDCSYFVQNYSDLRRKSDGVIVIRDRRHLLDLAEKFLMALLLDKFLDDDLDDKDDKCEKSPSLILIK